MGEKINLDDILRPLSPEEMENLTPLSDEVIRAALQQGKEEAERCRAYCNAVGPPSDISYL